MKKLFQSILVLTLVALLLPHTASASGYTNYTTIPATQQEQEDFLGRINFHLIDTKNEEYSIDRFAVSEQGQVALAFNLSGDAEINVFDVSGNYLYGFQFANNGCALAVFFEEEMLSIYWGKSSYIGSFDAEGRCILFRKLEHNASNSASYHNDRYRPSSGKVGEFLYFAESIGFSTKYTKFTVEDQAGNKTVIFNITEETRSELIIICVLGALIASFVMLAIYKHNKTERDTRLANED